MAGRRPKNIRSGDLNEELGMLLLRAVAAVAPVPRTEDVGIDAVATLLRDGPGASLIAEHSFYVQFKSSSIEVLEYQGHEVDWLRSLKLPFLIGSVNKSQASMDLFAAHRLSQVLVEGRYSRIELVLDRENRTGRGFDPETEEITNDRRRVNIGPPLVKWSALDLAIPTILDNLYSCINAYLTIEQRNVQCRELRYAETLHWNTGEPPTSRGGAHYQTLGQDEDILNVFRSMVPQITALSLRASLTNDRSVLEMVVQLIEYMRRNGFDPDPHNIHLSQLLNWDKLARPGNVMQ